MARPLPVPLPPLFPALLPALLLLPLLLPLLPALPPQDAPLPSCPPGRFRCPREWRCFPLEWRCDGHPDCEDAEDERGCATATPAEPSPEGAGGSGTAGSAGPSATPVPGDSVPPRSQGRLWVLIVAVLLSILVAVGSVTVWGLSKAKTRSGIFSPEKASREQLMPDKSQTG